MPTAATASRATTTTSVTADPTSATAILQGLFRYQAWANREFLRALQGLDPVLHAEPRHTALRLLNHNLVVGHIFAAHLQGQAHTYTSDSPMEPPTLRQLQQTLPACDRWYLDYSAHVTPEQLAEPLPFVFTDGDHGCMTRLEMLLHVATHAAYHRGEVGRILKQLDAPMPWDTLAVHLHASEPQRRAQAILQPVP